MFDTALLFISNFRSVFGLSEFGNRGMGKNIIENEWGEIPAYKSLSSLFLSDIVYLREITRSGLILNIFNADHAPTRDVTMKYLWTPNDWQLMY